MPGTVPDEWKAEFLSRKKYKVAVPGIKKSKNTFVSHEGIALKNGLLVPGSAFNLFPGKNDKSFYYTFWRTCFEQFLTCKYGKSLRCEKVSDPLVLVHSRWFNYAFWMNEYLPRLIRAYHAGLFSKARLLLPEGISSHKFVRETLGWFQDVQTYVLPLGHHLMAKELYIPENRSYTAAIYPPEIRNTRLFLKKLLKIEDVKPFRRIYLSRKTRGTRCVANEAEIMALLEPHGFKIVQFEDMSVEEQIRCMHETEIFVSLHGAGFTNVMFMQPDTHVVELINEPYARKEYTFPYWKLTVGAGMHYYPLFCPVAHHNPEALQLDYGKNHSETDAANFLVNQDVIAPIQQLQSIMEQIMR